MNPAAWALGLSPAQQAEWFVDCYRMRVDDDYVHGGGDLRGLYDPDHDPGRCPNPQDLNPQPQLHGHTTPTPVLVEGGRYSAMLPRSV